MRTRGGFLARAVAIAALVGCHGAAIHEATTDGGAARGGTGGGAARGGTGGAARGGTGGGARGGTGGGAGAGGGMTGTGGDGDRAGSGGTAGTGSAGTGAAAGTGGEGGAAGAAIGGVSGRGGASGSGGSGGAGGRGGTGGTSGTGGGGAGGSGGAGGAGCAAQMTPAMFYRGDMAPIWMEGGSHRFYWAEETNPYLTFHYSPGDPPMEILHPLQIDESLANAYFDLAGSDLLVGGIWYLDGRLGVWGPDVGSTQVGMKTLTNPGAIAIAGGTVYYSFNPMGGNPTPGIYQWAPPAPASLFASYPSLGAAGNQTLGLLLRASGSKLLLCTRRDVYMVDQAAAGAAQPLFLNPFNSNVIDLRPARPRSLDGGVIVDVNDDTFYTTGRDYYVNITQPTNAPTDLSIATSLLADGSACGAAAHYNGAGVLFHDRYVYEGKQGLFAVDVSAAGGVSNLVRLTDAPFRYIEVTGDGDLFAGWAYGGIQWDYYRIGRL